MNVVITGASSGIGKSVAEYLSSRGHVVIGSTRSLSGKSLSSVELLELDVNDDNSVATFYNSVCRRFDKVDVLINNAGFVLSGPAESTSMAECKAQFETNYFGVVRMTNAFLPLFRRQKHGLIINVSSLGGLISMPYQVHYSASKYALEGYTEAMRMELAPFHINMCNINPGDLRTSFTVNRRMTSRIETAYAKKFEQIMHIFEDEEKNGADPIVVAKCVEQIINKKSVRMRYIVGKRSQTVAYTIKRLVGHALFEKVLMLMWKVR